MKRPCLDDVEILEYVERRIPTARIDDIHQHIDTCGDCLALIVVIVGYSSRERPFVSRIRAMMTRPITP